VWKRWAALPTGARWVVGGFVAIVIALGIAWVLLVPAAGWLAHLDAGSATGSMLETARDNARGRLLTLGAGLFAAGALIFTARNYALSREGQVTDRYSKAIEQLGSDSSDVRTGGIYALERLARDSARDHPTVMEVLTAFVREQPHKQEPEEADNQAEVDAPLRTTRPDVQAAVSVIGRRDPKNDRQAVNLNSADLTGADLTGAQLASARLNGADLTGAQLTRADLTGAQLTRANLTGADLTSARLASAWLPGVDFTRAILEGASLIRANLAGVTLTGADLSFADLTSAQLTLANVAGTNLSRVYLTDAVWPPDAAVPEGWQLSSKGHLARVPSARPAVTEIVPDWVRKYLFPTERTVIIVRKNPTAIIAPVISTLVGLSIALSVTNAIPPAIAGFRSIVWVLWGLLFVWGLWRVATWMVTYFVVTDRRMMLASGLLRRSVKTLPLTKVTDLSLQRSFGGHLLGYADLIIESAGQELSRVPSVPFPQQLIQEIAALIFPRTAGRDESDPSS